MTPLLQFEVFQGRSGDRTTGAGFWALPGTSFVVDGRGGRTAGRSRPRSRVSSPTSRALMPARAWCGMCGEHFIVVPAKAGTHTLRLLLVTRCAAAFLPFYVRRWLWVPACAGTTERAVAWVSLRST